MFGTGFLSFSSRASGRLRAFCVLLAVGCAFLVSTSYASADYTWTGDFLCGNQYGCSYDTGWHEGNWTTAPPEASEPNLGTLNLPALPNCGQGACYSSVDDLSFSMSATKIDIDDAVGYQIGSDADTGPAPAIGLGSGGFNATPTAATNGDGAGLFWDQELDLTAPQTWTLTGDGTWQDTPITIGAPITAGGTNPSADALTIDLSNNQYLTFIDGLEVGAVTVSGANSSDTGYSSAQNGTLIANDINGDDDAPVTIDNVEYTIEPNEDHQPHTQTVGPLTTNGAFLQIGDGNAPDASFDVRGTVDLGAGSVTGTEIDQSGSTPGTDFAQLSATGNVALGGQLVADGGGCSMGVGDVATPITTMGALSGTFANAPDGAMMPLQVCFAENQGGLGVQVRYTAKSVTETVVPASSTSTLLSTDPTDAAANQPVTLSADVTAATFLYAGPAGTVEFFDGATPIPGCTAQPVAATNANTGGARCTTSFATPDMSALTAVFTPSAGSGLTGSTSGAPGTRSGSGTTGNAAGGNGSPGGSGGGTSSSSAGSSATTTAVKSAIAKIGNTKVTGTGVGVPLTCSGGLPCTLALTLSVTEKLKNGRVTAIAARVANSKTTKITTRTVTLGHETVTVASNGTSTARLTLNPLGKRLLNQHHRLATKLSIALGGRTLTTKVVTFKAATKR